MDSGNNGNAQVVRTSDVGGTTITLAVRRILAFQGQGMVANHIASPKPTISSHKCALT